MPEYIVLEYIVPLPGKAVEELYGSGLRKEVPSIDRALQNATVRKRGTGESWIIRIDRTAAEALLEFFTDRGEAFVMQESKPEVRADGRACLMAARRIEMALAVGPIEESTRESAEGGNA